MRFSHAIRDRKAVAGYAGITDSRSDSDRLARHPSPRGLRPLAFAEAYAGAAAVPVDEFNAGRFQSATYCQIIRCCHRSLVVSEFGAADSSNSHGGFSREIFRSPPKESTSSPNLGASEGQRSHIDILRLYGISDTIRYPSYRAYCREIFALRGRHEFPRERKKLP